MGLTADSARSSRWAKGLLPSGDLGQDSSRCALNAQTGQCLDRAGHQERPRAPLVDITLQSIRSLG